MSFASPERTLRNSICSGELRSKAQYSATSLCRQDALFWQESGFGQFTRKSPKKNRSTGNYAFSRRIFRGFFSSTIGTKICFGGAGNLIPKHGVAQYFVGAFSKPMEIINPALNSSSLYNLPHSEQ